METIAIQVDHDVAKAYREATPTEQRKIQQLLNTWLKQTMQHRPLDDITLFTICRPRLRPTA